MNSTDYRQSHQGDGFGSHYEVTLQFKWQQVLMEMERCYLGKILKCRAPRKALDFACGTGRVLECVAAHVADCTGVDISSDMLEICRRKVPESTQIICGDISHDDQLLGMDAKFDFITAFRFFPNAQQQLREDVMGNLVSFLSEEGVLIFNNHRNSGSFLYSFARLLKRSDMQSMTRKEVVSLLDKYDLKILEKKGFGALPAWNQWVLVPVWLHWGIDMLTNLLGLSEFFCQDVLYVCSRK